MAVVSTGQITIIDVNDYTYQGTTAPKNPIPNVTIWIDTSVSPSVMKRWTGTVWEIVNEVKIGGRNYLRNSGNFKNLYFWSTYVSTSATLVGSVMRITAGASSLPRYINTTLIPLTDSPQDFIISVRYIGEIEVNIGGKSSTSLSSIVENSNTQSAGTFTKIRTDNFPNNEKISYFYWKTLVKGDALSSFVWINIPINTTIDLISIKLEKGNKATDWTPAPEDVETLITQEIQDVENKITGLETTVNTTFKDGIIEQAEAKAIEKYINSLNAEKSDIDNQYNTIYNDALLTGTAKDNLFSQKESYNTAHSQLIGSINTAIADGKTTPSEKSNVDSKFTNYKNVLGGLAIRLTEALKAIEAKRIDNVQIGGRNLLVGSDYFKDFNTFGNGSIELNKTLKIYDSFYGNVRCTQILNITTAGYYTISFTCLEINSSNKFFIELKNSTTGVGSNKKQIVLGKNVFTLYIPTGNYYIVNFYANAPSLDNTKWCLIKNDIKVEIGNKATDWTPAPEDVETLITQEIQDVENKITGLETTVNTTFKDGIIEQAEAKAIEKYINSLNAEKSDIDNQYNTIYNDALLTGTAKDNLFSQKESYNTAHSQLLSSINTAIADGKTTPLEKSDVDSKFTNYKNVLGGLAIRLTEALKAIEAKRIDNVQIGGRNLMINSKGEFRYAISITTTEPLNIGDTYTLSFDVIGNPNGNIFINKSISLNYDASGTGWRRKNVTFSFIKNDYNGHEIFPHIYGADAVKNVKLEKGNKATDWTPAPEDQVSDWNTTDTNSFSFIKNKPTDDIAKGVQAYNWGNHASAGYALANGTNATGNWGINITGNAATATKLQTPRKINGVSFDGSEDITINAGTNYTAGTNISISDNQISVVSSPTFTGSVTATAFYESSLRNLKENILPFESSGLGLISQLEIVTYDRKDGSVKDKIGIIADDSPEEFLSEDKDAVDLYKTVFIQAKAIQELKSEVDELKEELNNLRDLIMLNLNQF